MKTFHHKISQRKKEKNDFEWYKHHINMLDTGSFNSVSGFGGIPERRRMRANYNLYNNIIDPEEFKYVCRPYGDAVGEMPATFTNRDIVSGKIKVLLGMEMKRPFSWKVVAVNEEATTRKEEEEFGRIRQYVISQVMQPIIEEIRLKYEQENAGRELTPEEQKQIQQQVQQEMEAATPDEVRKYMQRVHQDPAEAAAHQLLEYFIQKLSLKEVFNDGWKHGLLSGVEVYWCGSANDNIMLSSVNPVRFDYDKSDDVKFIEDGEWACMEYEMSPSKVVEFFADELTDSEIDQIYEYCYSPNDSMIDPDFRFREDMVEDATTIRVYHANFKSLRKIGFVTYYDPYTDSIQEKIVDENYRIMKDAGDISIDWTWIPEEHEGYKIGRDIFKRMRPVPGQHNDLNDLYTCKLSYRGGCYDNTNSEITSLMDRMKAYQYYYNIIMYRIEMLMASDKGKILMMNLNMIPKSKGIDISKFLYYTDASKIGFLNPAEEGNRGGQGGDIVNAVKEIDMSLAQSIQQYIALAEYIETRCGNSVGVTKAMEGQAAPNESVGNNQLNYTQSSYILEPYFDFHNQIKKNVIQALLDKAKYIYHGQESVKLAYAIDDMTTQYLNVETSLLMNSTLGIFVSNSAKAWEAKEAIQSLSHAAMQNNKAELSDVVKVIRSESVQEAEELLAVAEELAHKRDLEINRQAEEYKLKVSEQEQAFKREEWKHEKELAVIKETERRKTVIQQQAILSMGFNVDKDVDRDGVPDVLELAKYGVEADIKMRKQVLDEMKFEQQKVQDGVNNQLAEKKLKIEAKKALSK